MKIETQRKIDWLRYRGLEVPSNIEELTYAEVHRLAVVELGEKQLEGELYACVSCDDTTRWPHDNGWKFVTQYDGEARWLCRTCAVESG